MAEKFLIKGSRKLHGEIEVRGAKNAAFPVLAATLLTKEDCVIKNLPLIEDVHRMLEILQSMGADVEWAGERTVKINTAHIDPAKISRELVCKFRGSVLLFGPLLARFRSVVMPMPGGCVIGARPIDTHLDAFSQLGISVNPARTGFALAVSEKEIPKEIILNEFSVTGTANAMLYAAGVSSDVRIKIADQDYQIQELAAVLNRMGARLTFLPSHEIAVRGKRALGGFTHSLMYDPMEAGTFVALAAASKGVITVRNVEYSFLELFFKKLKGFGVPFTIKPVRRAGVSPEWVLADITLSPWKTLRMDKIQSWIYPGVHSDLQSVLGVLATQAKGSTLLHDPLYEGRLKYLEELNKMGAEIYFADPHRAIINGPTPLYGADLGPLDLRGGAALIIAALIAKGTSTIGNAYQVDRGYEKIEERLRAIGADMTRVS